MSFTIEKHPDLPVIISTFYSDFNLNTESETFAEELLRVMDSQEEPVYGITDSTRLETSFGEMVSALATFTRGSLVSLFTHPNVIHSIVVDNHALARVAVNALGQAQYGERSVSMYESLDEALAVVQSALDENPA